MKSSITGRSLKLLSLATQVGRKELSQNIRERFTKTLDDVASGRMKTRVDQARLIVEHLSQLKGAAMKVGQMLSLDAADYFPPEAVDLLTKLQGQAEPVDWAILQKVLNEELGPEKIKQFTQLSTTPAASASIGQVHRGHLYGKDVAVKIQYPGVADSIDSDLAILRTLAQSLLGLSGRKIDLAELFEEFATVLKQEADYTLEYKNMLEFGKLLEGDKDFSVPKPIDSHCTQRVLTMEWLPGINVRQWLKSKPSRTSRERIGRLALDLYCREFYDWGFVQTDPNYGNFLIQPETLTLGLLDFGAALHYPQEFRESYVNLLRILNSGDKAKIVQSFIDFELIDPRESAETQQAFFELMTLSLEPFQKEHQPFRFANNDFNKRIAEVGQKFTRSLKYSAPPKKILFLHRKLGGVFSLLKTLEVELDLLPYWERMLGSR